MTKFIDVKLDGQKYKVVTLNTNHIVSISHGIKFSTIKMADGDVIFGDIQDDLSLSSEMLVEQQFIPATPGYVKIHMRSINAEKLMVYEGYAVVGWAVVGGSSWSARAVSWEGEDNGGGYDEHSVSAILDPNGRIVDFEGCSHETWDEYLADESNKPEEGWSVEFRGLAPRPKSPEAKAAIYAPKPKKGDDAGDAAAEKI